MSVNEIDINAVNARTEAERNNTAGTTPQATQRGRLLNTWRGRMMMRYLSVLMFLESIVWTAMDLIRAHRMKWARKMKQYDGTLTSNEE